MISKKIIISSVIYILLSVSLGAQGKLIKRERISIAVIDLNTNNCPASYGKAMAEMISGKLFHSEKFVLLERSQIAVILREKGFKKKTLIDANYVAGLGRILSVEKVVVGSISKLGDYKIELRVVNVKNVKVEMSVSRNVSDTDEFERIAGHVVQRIDDHYSGRSSYSGNFDLVVTAGMKKPFGDLKIAAESAFAGDIILSVNNFYDVPDLMVMFQTGFYFFNPKERHVDYMFSSPFAVYAGFRWHFTRYISMVPAAGAGYMCSIVRRDTIQNRTYGERKYNTYFYFNPIVGIKTEIDILIAHRYYLVIAPHYNLFWENESVGHYAGIDFGLRVMF